jgi:DNA/RNA-binding domain of Phe-tRNA-synthetase-like protein
MFIVTDAWKAAYPGACAGILEMHDVMNSEAHPGLDERKATVENDLRARLAGADRAAIKALPTLRAYEVYFGRFKKTYHVQLQLESVALKGKPIPRVAALVEAMFMAELKNQLLTAGHDLAALRQPITLGAADGTERYVGLSGQEQTLKADDMFMSDAEGVISSVLHGPDRRTAIIPATCRAVFAVYAPAGIGADAVHAHLQDIESNVRLVAPDAVTASLDIYCA